MLSGQAPVVLVLVLVLVLAVLVCIQSQHKRWVILIITVCPNVMFSIVGLRLLEYIKLAPAGTCKVQKMLLEGGEGCMRGGRLGIFTPMYMVVVRKPLNKEE